MLPFLFSSHGEQKLKELLRYLRKVFNYRPVSNGADGTDDMQEIDYFGELLDQISHKEELILPDWEDALRGWSFRKLYASVVDEYVKHSKEFHPSGARDTPEDLEELFDYDARRKKTETDYVWPTCGAGVADGYTCGLWTLFHMFTVRSGLKVF